MERHELLNYLKQPALLTDISVERLREQVAAFPYAANLRLLLLLKARQCKDAHYEQYLAQFAAVTFDRPHLFDLVQSLSLGVERSGEVLELLELEELELAPLSSAYEELPSRLNEVPLPVSSTVDETSTDGTSTDKQVHSSISTEPAKLPLREITPTEAPTTEVPIVVAPPVDPPLPDPPQHFTLPLPLGLTFEERMHALRNIQPLREAPPQGGALSETLADLLVRQGQPARAIEMYRRLGLVNPEKKSIFAGLIQELKEKI